MEADMEDWWHSQVSSPVLVAWNRFPRTLQTSHTAPLREETIPKNVNTTSALYINRSNVPGISGEIKRNLISPVGWATGRLSSSQQKLSQELRDLFCLLLYCLQALIIKSCYHTDKMLGMHPSTSVHRYSVGMASIFSCSNSGTNSRPD